MIPRHIAQVVGQQGAPAGALRSELPWFLGTLAALMLAMAASILAIAAKLFDVV